MANIDSQMLKETLDDIFDEYEKQRISSIFAPAKGTNKVSPEFLLSEAGKGVAARELRSKIYNRLAFEQ